MVDKVDIRNGCIVNSNSFKKSFLPPHPNPGGLSCLLLRHMAITVKSHHSELVVEALLNNDGHLRRAEDKRAVFICYIIIKKNATASAQMSGQTPSVRRLISQVGGLISQFSKQEKHKHGEISTKLYVGKIVSLGGANISFSVLIYGLN